MYGLPFFSAFLQVWEERNSPSTRIREERNSPSTGDFAKSGNRGTLLQPEEIWPLADSDKDVTSAWADGLQTARKANSKIGGKAEENK
jgi:hypothetical protein